MMNKLLSDTDPEQLKALYLEVCAFLQSCGGTYLQLQAHQCRRLLECLDHGQYLMRRDAQGVALQFVAYWKSTVEQLSAAQHYRRPEDPFTGPAIFTVDYASRSGIKGVFDMFNRMLTLQEPEVTILSFEHKGRLVTYDRSGHDGHPWILRR